jgi:hypothetical protein
MAFSFSNNDKNNEIFRTRHLRCQKQDCEEFIVMHLGFLDYTHYILTVHFFGLESFHLRYAIKEVTFYVSFNNKYNIILPTYFHKKKNTCCCVHNINSYYVRTSP